MRALRGPAQQPSQAALESKGGKRSKRWIWVRRLLLAATGLAHVPILEEGAWPRVTDKVRELLPPLTTARFTLSPGLYWARARARSDSLFIALPSISVMTSPLCSPAFAAGEPDNVSTTTAPWETFTP